MKHEIIIYTDARGRAPLRDYLMELKAQNSNDARIRLSKIQDYISLLQEKGTALPKPNASIFLTRSIPGFGSFARAVTGFCFLPGMAECLFCCMLSENKARKRRMLNSGKRNGNTKTGRKGMIQYEQEKSDVE